jgi:hypothetical protein
MEGNQVNALKLNQFETKERRGQGHLVAWEASTLRQRR